VSGWRVAGIMTEQSGTPFSVLSGRGTLNRAARSANETARMSLDKSQVDDLFSVQMTGNGPFFVPQSIKGSDGRAGAADAAAPFRRTGVLPAGRRQYRRVAAELLLGTAARHLSI
jgi:hypothetical protein